MIQHPRQHIEQRNARAIRSMILGSLGGNVASARPYRPKRRGVYEPAPVLTPAFVFDAGTLEGYADNDRVNLWPDGIGSADLTTVSPFFGGLYVADWHNAEPAVQVTSSPNRTAMQSAFGAIGTWDDFTLFCVVEPDATNENGCVLFVLYSVEGIFLWFGWEMEFDHGYENLVLAAYLEADDGGSSLRAQSWDDTYTETVEGVDMVVGGTHLARQPQVLVAERSAGNLRIYCNNDLIASAGPDTAKVTEGTVNLLELGNGTDEQHQPYIAGYDWADATKRAQVTSGLMTRFGISA